MDYKNSKAKENTVTYNRKDIEKDKKNIYESIVIIAKRANQINAEMKTELLQKLDEFATHNEGLEEIFENREQIEVSKFYEKLPKHTAIGIEEWLQDRIYHRNTEETGEL